LTGTFADGLGGIKTDAKRVDFDPFPWQSFAVWMLTQMKRWGQIKGDVDYKSVAEQVYLATDNPQADAGDGADAAGIFLQVVFGDGQDLRPGEARGLSRELQDQEGVVICSVASSASSPLPACGERSDGARQRAIRVRGTHRARSPWRVPLTPTLSPQAGRGR